MENRILHPYLTIFIFLQLLEVEGRLNLEKVPNVNILLRVWFCSIVVSKFICSLRILKKIRPPTDQRFHCN